MRRDRADGADVSLFRDRIGPRVDTSPGRRQQSDIKFAPLVQRASQRGGQTGIKRIGLHRNLRSDFYHNSLIASWPRFLSVTTIVYLAINVVFGSLYALQPGSIANARPGVFLDAFFFSVETLGTIGYGVLAPATLYGNILMTVEELVSIVLIALTTGLIFARVSRPTARVLFAKVAVVTERDGTPTLMIRMGNERTSQIVQADIGMTLIRNERSQEGEFMRRFYDLKLERERTPIFAMSYLAMHKIVPDSPLYGATPQTLKDVESEILVTVTGLDETMAQTVHARASYLPDEVIFGQRYSDIFGFTDDGERAVDYRRFHMVEAPIQRSATGAPAGPT